MRPWLAYHALARKCSAAISPAPNHALQPAAQQTMKQMVVPIPKPLFVQAHREQVRVFQPLQVRLAVGRHILRSHDRITQGSAEHVEDRGLEEKILQLGWDA